MRVRQRAARRTRTWAPALLRDRTSADSIRRPALDALRAELASAAAKNPACPTRRRGGDPRKGEEARRCSTLRKDPRWLLRAQRAPPSASGSAFGAGTNHISLLSCPTRQKEATQPRAKPPSKHSYRADSTAGADRLLTRYLALDSDVLAAPDLQEGCSASPELSFAAIAASGVLSLAAEAVEDEDEIGRCHSGPTTPTSGEALNLARSWRRLWMPIFWKIDLR